MESYADEASEKYFNSICCYIYFIFIGSIEMIEIISAIGLSGQAFYSLHQKSKHFSSSGFSTLSTVFAIATVIYIFIAFNNYELHVPIMGVVIGGTIAAFLQSFLNILLKGVVSSEIETTSLIEIAYSVIALILVLQIL